MGAIDSLFLGLLVLMMIPVVLTDLRERRIPNVWNAALAAAGLAHAVLRDPRWMTLAIVVAQAAVSLLVLVGTTWLMRRISKQSRIGWGDLKFLVAASFWVGMDGTVLVLFLASLGALLSAVAVAPWQGLNLRQMRPFGPMLAGGLIVVATGLFLQAGP